MFTKRITVSAIAAALLAVQAAWAEQLPSDSRILTGKLDNGVTWMYRQHDNPPGKMALMVHIDTGSLNETESQRGLAHFTEHMVFNGSENFPPGELIPYFESIGMDFGGDINAFTSFDQTSYMLFLPDTDLKEIDKGLMVLSDQAFRASFLDEEVEKERGVILSEKRAGMSAQQRIRDKLWPEVFAGSRFADRMVIGLEDVIANAPRSEFVDYYRTWYRPERVTVLLVGDASPDPIIPLIDKWFGQYRLTAETRPEHGPEFKHFTEQRAFIVTDPEFSRGEVAMYNIRPGRPPTTTVEQARVDLLDELGGWILQRRFSDRLQSGDASYTQAFASAFNFFNDAMLVMGQASGEPENWEKMLDELIEEVGRARQYGFTERELELARKEFLSDAERAVKTESTQNARRILMEMDSAVNDREPIMSAEQELEIVKRLLPTVTLAEVSKAFADNFEAGSFAYVLTMPEKEDVKLPSNDELLAAARAALAKKVAPPSEEKHAESLLAEMPAPGKVAEQTRDEDLDITHLWLDNGVRVHHRYMDYKKDSVMVTISLAGGQIEETAANAGVTETASLILDQPATSRLTSNDITDLMTGENIRVRGNADGDAMVVSVSGSPEDLEKGLQLAHALLTDGKLEQSAFDNWKESALQRYKMFEKQPQFVAIRALRDVLSGGDPRLTMTDPDRINAQSIEAAQKWFDRLCAQAPIEVAVVGEIKLEEVMPLIETYIGSLAQRPRSAERLDSLRTLKRGVGPLVEHVSVDTITPQAMIMYGFVGADASNERDDQALQLAAKTLSSQLIKQIREELGQVYSIGAQSQASEVYRDAGVFMAGAPCAPENPEGVIAEIETIYGAFAKSGPTAEELENARKQVLNDLDTQMKEPRFWLGQLSHADLHAIDFAELKCLRQSFEELTAEQVRETFCKYYQPARVYEVIARPNSGSAEPGDGEEVEKKAEPAAAD